MAIILVIDDRQVNREFLRVVLEHAGHTVFEASDGVEALQRVDTIRPQLVITDILMPTMDGKEFVRRLRAHPEFSSVPTLFTSAYYLESEARSLGEQCGVNGFIPKPCDPEAVLAIVAWFLPVKSAEPGQNPLRRANGHGTPAPNRPPGKEDEASAVQARLLALTEVSRELSHCDDIGELSRTYATAIRRIVAAEMAVVHLDAI